jgi:hypothetical protein
MPETYTPKGRHFYDGASEREMLLVEDPDSGFDGWLCYKGAEGQWVTLRRATDADRAVLEDPRVVDYAAFYGGDHA